VLHCDDVFQTTEVRNFCNGAHLVLRACVCIVTENNLETQDIIPRTGHKRTLIAVF